MGAVKCVLLDIEGTICPISFVKDTLYFYDVQFPYAIKALPNVLAAQWESEDFRPYRDAFPEEFRESPEALQSHVEDLTKRDVKIAYLKDLQGYLWEDGYKTGEYATDLFPDVAPQLRAWKDEGLALAIYSSGSVFAQKLLFAYVKAAEKSPSKKRARSAEDDETNDAATQPPSKKRTGISSEAAVNKEAASESKVPISSDEPCTTGHSTNGVEDDGPKADEQKNPTPMEDMTDLFDGWFDTTNAGLKTVAESYTKIAKSLNRKPEEILFLSDNVKEVDAAFAAEMQSILVDRPGNAPVSDADRQRLQVVETLSKIEISQGEETKIGEVADA